MSYSVLTLVPWLMTLVIAALHLTSAVILLRERHLGPWLMLTGSAIALVGKVGSMLIPVSLLRRGLIKNEWMLAIAAFSSLGALLFAIGLLLHALRQRGKANRIAELEAILNSRNS
jgi:hypothetical protein